MIKGLAYEFPLRPGFMVQIVVPRDLTVQEAERLYLFLLALAVDISPEMVTSFLTKKPENETQA